MKEQTQVAAGETATTEASTVKMPQEIINTIHDILEDVRAGKPVVIVDDESRENEGDVFIAAEFATQENINFMAKEARGIICTPMLGKDLDRLNITPMVAQNTDNHETAFTVSVDHVETTTGVSPAERAFTIQALLSPEATGSDFRRPGHVFPLRYKEGGVFVRQGHTEASIDLCRLAGCYEASVICEITNDDGTMARMPDLIAFAEKFNLKMCTVADLIAYRKLTEDLITEVNVASLPTKYGMFQMAVFKNRLDDKEHVAIVKGAIQGEEDVLCRIHSECLTGDVFGSQRCDCGEQLAFAMRTLEKKGNGIICYMRQEGRGIGLTNKIKAYALQEQGMDTIEANLELGFPADMREYCLAAQMLRRLGVKSVKLMTNNMDKAADLVRWGIPIHKRVPVVMKPNCFNRGYLQTKRDKMGHKL